MGSTLVRPAIYVASAKPFVGTSPNACYRLWRIFEQHGVHGLAFAAWVEEFVDCLESSKSAAQIFLLSLLEGKTESLSAQTVKQAISTIGLMSAMTLSDKLRFVYNCYVVQVSDFIFQWTQA